MRLLSCYIAGFGKFINRSFDLSADLTVFKEDNGWGKTTLADFLKCMFYGLDNSRKKSVAENERIKYEPWQGGAFGGTLTFSCNGKTYRLERAFGKTAAYDTAKLYDANNMLCFDFGDKLDRLGETLFGIDGEGYARCAYTSQTVDDSGELPVDIKSRLLSLLSGSGKGESSAEIAVRRLDEAERALRAKRRPAKGKLDEIDEKLELLSRMRAESDGYAEQFSRIQSELLETDARLVSLNKRAQELSVKIERISRRNEWEAKKATYQEVQAGLSAAKGELETLRAFFGDIDPASVNVDGLQTAVTEYYALLKELEDIKQKLDGLQAHSQEYATLTAQMEASKKAVDSYELILQKAQETDEAGTQRTQKRRIGPKAGKWFIPLLLFGVFSAIIGAIFIDSQPTLGGGLFALGCASLAFLFFSSLRRYPKRRKTKESYKEWEIKDKALADAYLEAQTQYAEARNRLQSYAATQQDTAELTALYAQKQARATELEKGIRAFLDNFGYKEHYDYRASLQTLTENVDRYVKASKAFDEYAQKSTAFTGLEQSEGTWEDVGADEQTLKIGKAETDRQKEELVAYRERLLSQAEALEKARQERSEFLSETDSLLTEKQRLEKRLTAIRAAREMLIKARSNLASRYLEPLESATEEYLRFFGSHERLQFNAQGKSYVEESGMLRETEYYSAGMEDLLNFCVRIALADAVFLREKPTLILDDPFVNFDDKKTEAAKEFVKALSKRYQILYFTCKTERQPR